MSLLNQQQTEAKPFQAEAPEEVTLDDLKHWKQLCSKLKIMKEEEMELRKKIAAFYFQDPKIGTNTHKQDGVVIKFKKSLNISVDAAVLPAVLKELPDDYEQHLVKYKPELMLKNYKTLPADSKAIFDECLIVKDASPSITVELGDV